MRRGAFRLLLAQGGLTAFLSVIATCVFDIPVAYSVLVGGFVCMIANGFFMYHFFMYYGARAAQKIVYSMYLGECMKLLLTGILMSIAFIYGHVAPLPCILTYLITYQLYFLVPFLFRETKNI